MITNEALPAFTDLTTVGAVVTEDYRTAQLFKKHDIDFWNGGSQSLAQACQKAGIEVEDLLKELRLISDREYKFGLDFKSWDLEFIIDFINKTHHVYVAGNRRFLLDLAVKVAEKHGINHPETIKVAEVFSRIEPDLASHMKKEEELLFPIIKKLVKAERTGTGLNELKSIERGVFMAESEHEQAGYDFRELRELTSEYAVPADACNSYRILYEKLLEFENDLSQHIHLENNILFPRAIAIEKRLAAGQTAS